MTEEMLCQIFSTNLKRLRIERGLTAQQLADKAGMAASTVRHMAKGYGLPTAKSFANVVNALDTTPMEFFR